MGRVRAAGALLIASALLATCATAPGGDEGPGYLNSDFYQLTEVYDDAIRSSVASGFGEKLVGAIHVSPANRVSALKALPFDHISREDISPAERRRVETLFRKHLARVVDLHQRHAEQLSAAFSGPLRNPSAVKLQLSSEEAPILRSDSSAGVVLDTFIVRRMVVFSFFVALSAARQEVGVLYDALLNPEPARVAIIDALRALKRDASDDELVAAVRQADPDATLRLDDKRRLADIRWIYEMLASEAGALAEMRTLDVSGSKTAGLFRQILNEQSPEKSLETFIDKMVNEAESPEAAARLRERIERVASSFPDITLSDRIRLLMLKRTQINFDRLLKEQLSFVLGHEMGHYVLDHFAQIQFPPRCEQLQKIEREADTYGAIIQFAGQPREIRAQNVLDVQGLLDTMRDAYRPPSDPISGIIGGVLYAFGSVVTAMVTSLISVLQTDEWLRDANGAQLFLTDGHALFGFDQFKTGKCEIYDLPAERERLLILRTQFEKIDQD